MPVSLCMRPSELRFTQDSISDEFGRDTGETIEQTYKDLLYGDMDVGEIRPLSVVQHEDQYWVVSGNRRLYVYKRLERDGVLDDIQVNEIPINYDRFQQMFTTRNNGQRVFIRQDRRHPVGDKLSDRLDRIYSEWCRSKDDDGDVDTYGYTINTINENYWPPVTNNSGTASASNQSVQAQPLGSWASLASALPSSRQTSSASSSTAAVQRPSVYSQAPSWANAATLETRTPTVAASPSVSDVLNTPVKSGQKAENDSWKCIIL